MENENLSNSDKFKNALCYVPFVAIVFFFTEENKSQILMKHIKYGTYLLLAFIIAQFVITWLFMLPIGWILFLIYAWCTWYLWWKAYNWNDINIEYIDDFEKKIKNNLNDDTIVKKNSPQPSPQGEGVKGKTETQKEEKEVKTEEITENKEDDEIKF